MGIGIEVDVCVCVCVYCGNANVTRWWSKYLDANCACPLDTRMTIWKDISCTYIRSGLVTGWSGSFNQSFIDSFILILISYEVHPYPSST